MLSYSHLIHLFVYSFSNLSPTTLAYIQEWSTYNDWISLNIRQILVEIHGVPTPKGMETDAVTKKFFQTDLDVTEFYDAFTKHGYALYNRDEHGAGPELSFVKLEREFWE